MQRKLGINVGNVDIDFMISVIVISIMIVNSNVPLTGTILRSLSFKTIA